MTLAIVGSIETERGAMGAVGARRRRIDRSEYDAACSARLAPRVRSGPGGGHTRPARPLRVHPVTAARAALVHFEVAHGVTAEDWQSVFRDATGRLQQTERYRHIAALYALFAEEAETAIVNRGSLSQRKLLDDLLLRNVDLDGVVDGAERGHHAEERSAEHAHAGPEGSGSFGSVVTELR